MTLTKAEFEARLRALVKASVLPTATAFLAPDGRVTARGSYNIGGNLTTLSAQLYNDTVASPVIPMPAPTPVTTLYNAPQQVSRLVAQHPDLAVLANTPTAVWFGNEWIPNPATSAQSLVSAAAGKLITLVIYSIPGRDNGSYSGGGLNGPAAYASYIDQLANGMGKAPVWYVLEPDALGILPTDSTKRAERISMLKNAVSRLKRDNPNARVYVDASMWVPPTDMANLIKQVNPGNLDGFSLNVSAYNPMSTCHSWADQVSANLGGMHYVIDTSRNGKGTAGNEWCNPAGQGTGLKPTLATGKPVCDAYLWIKAPGESDGTCNGGPPAGQFWVDRARELVRNGV